MASLATILWYALAVASESLSGVTVKKLCEFEFLGAKTYNYRTKN
jgi:hypothetical protein